MRELLLLLRLVLLSCLSASLAGKTMFKPTLSSLSAILFGTFLSVSAFGEELPGVYVRIAEIKNAGGGRDVCSITFALTNTWDKKLNEAQFDVFYYDKDDALLGKDFVYIPKTGKIGVEQQKKNAAWFSCSSDEFGRIELKWSDATEIDGDMIRHLNRGDEIIDALTAITWVDFKTPVKWSEAGQNLQEIKSPLFVEGCANCK